MPEAVIVATGRSPIGRAFKGSLVDVRPDDLAAHVVREVLAKIPNSIRTPLRTCYSVAGNRLARQALTSRASPRFWRASTMFRRNRQSLLLFVPADHTYGRSRD